MNNKSGKEGGGLSFVYHVQEFITQVYTGGINSGYVIPLYGEHTTKGIV